MVPKRFFDKVEFVMGPGLCLPNDHGYSEYIKNISSGSHTFGLESKIGYSVGVGFIHSVSKLIEIHGRILYEGKGYIQNDFVVASGDTYKFTSDYKNSYTTIAVMPTVVFGKKNRFHTYLGGYYGHLTNSTFTSTEYLNGQIQSIQQVIGNTSSYEGGILTGVGYSTFVKKMISIDLQIQGNFGLTNMINDNQIKITSNCLMFIVALKYYRGVK